MWSGTMNGRSRSREQSSPRRASSSASHHLVIIQRFVSRLKFVRNSALTAARTLTTRNILDSSDLCPVEDVDAADSRSDGATRDHGRLVNGVTRRGAGGRNRPPQSRDRGAQGPRSESIPCDDGHRLPLHQSLVRRSEQELAACAVLSQRDTLALALG